MGLIFIDCEASGPCPGLGHLTEFGAVDYTSWVERREWVTFHGVIFRRRPEDIQAFPDRQLQDSHHECLELVQPPEAVFFLFDTWLAAVCPTGRAVGVSDNPAFDWQWINEGFHRALGRNPLGHSCRRIGDFYAGLTGDFRNTQRWKRWRVTKHDHNPVHDAMGNVEAFEQMMEHPHVLAVVNESGGKMTP